VNQPGAVPAEQGRAKAPDPARPNGKAAPRPVYRGTQLQIEKEVPYD
jgi:hypothetical protein